MSGGPSSSHLATPAANVASSNQPVVALSDTTQISTTENSSRPATNPRTNNAQQRSQFAITIQSHLHTSRAHYYLYGTPDGFLYISPFKTNVTEFGLTLQEIEAQIRDEIISSYTAVLTASNVRSDDLLIQLKELQRDISQKRQHIFQLNQLIEKQYSHGTDKANEVVGKLFNSDNTVLERRGDLEPFVAQFYKNFKPFGNIPLIFFLLRMASDPNMPKEFNTVTKTYSNLKYYYDRQNYESVLLSILEWVKFIDKTALGNKILKGFVDLQEHLYKQQTWKEIVKIYNRVSKTASSQFNSENCNPHDELKEYIWNLIVNNNNKIPKFKFFISFQGFCQKMSYLIDAITFKEEGVEPNLGNESTKELLLQQIKDIREDKQFDTSYKKYEELVNRLYMVLWNAFKTIDKLDSRKFPNKWNNFNKIFVIIHYLNSLENPFARKKMSEVNKYDEDHKEALVQYQIHQNELDKSRVDTEYLTKEYLEEFRITQTSLFSIKFAMKWGNRVLSNEQILDILAEELNENFALPFLANKPNPDATSVHLVAPPAGSAKQLTLGFANKAPAANSERSAQQATQPAVAAASSTAVVPNPASPAHPEESNCCMM